MIFKPADQEKIESWLAKKDDEWLMGFYALLNEAKESHDKSQPRWEKQIGRTIISTYSRLLKARREARHWQSSLFCARG